VTQTLTACPSCARHLRASEPACPFCGAKLAERSPRIRALPTKRLARAAIFSFGAALAAAAPGCGNSHRTDDAGTDEEDAGYDAGSIAPPYGIPADDGGIAPLYGGAPPED
jgi:predicted RNA-binding Zn-ribbon protein involved in translation (DUF1610 family)